MTSRRRATSNQRWNKVAYVNVEIYNVNVSYFNVDISQFRQRRNTVVISNIEIQHVAQFLNVVNITNCKKLKINLFTMFPIFRKMIEEYLQSRKIS